MATNKELKNVFTKLVLLISNGGFTNRQTSDLAKDCKEAIDAIPDKEPEEPHFPLSKEDLNFVINHLNKQPENKTGEFNYFQEDLPEHVKKYPVLKGKANKIVGPGPRTEQDNRKLEKELHEQGAITATTDEVKRYTSYVNGLDYDDRAITFGAWLEKDREGRRKYNREAGDGHDEFS